MQSSSTIGLAALLEPPRERVHQVLDLFFLFRVELAGPLLGAAPSKRRLLEALQVVLSIETTTGARALRG